MIGKKGGLVSVNGKLHVISAVIGDRHTPRIIYLLTSGNNPPIQIVVWKE